MKEPSLEELNAFADGIDPYQKPHKLPTAKITIAELAFHEASHFVFDCMLLKMDLDFTPLESIIVSTTDPDKNGVNGVTPNLPEERMHDFWLKKFYIEEENMIRLTGNILCTIAGYCSYKKYIGNFESQDFIGQFEEGSNLMKYYNLENVPTFENNTEVKPIKDFVIIKHKLLSLANESYYNKRANFIKACTNFINEALQLMNIKSVNYSIRFIKNQLIKNKNKEINGQELAILVKEVQRFTNKVPFPKVVKRCTRYVSRGNKKRRLRIN